MSTTSTLFKTIFIPLIFAFGCGSGVSASLSLIDTGKPVTYGAIGGMLVGLILGLLATISWKPDKPVITIASVKKWWFVPFVIFLLGLCVYPSFKMSIQQRLLAHQFEINTQKYPINFSFPLSYYQAILTAEMNINEVHQIIQGYEKVFQCRQDEEVYYYFSQNDRQALRFNVWYDDQKKFRAIDGEDWDSRPIRTDGCQSGRISE